MMKKKIFSHLFVFLILGAMSLPLLAYAQTSSSLLPANFQIFPTTCNCPGSAPAWGCILQTFQNVLKFVVFLAVIALTIFIAWAGFDYMTTGGSPEKRSAANKRIVNAVLGLFITLAAFLLVDSLMKVIYDPSTAKFGPWNSILAEDTNGTDCLIVRANLPAIPSLTGPSNASGGAATSPPAATPSSPVSASAAKAAQCAEQNVAPSSTGYCAVHVREDLACAGLTSFNTNHPASAYQYGPYLTNAGFTSVSTSGYTPQAGDVAVFQPVPGHSDGHIEIYNGTNWDSDFSQNSMYANSAYQNGSYAIYRWPSGS